MAKISNSKTLFLTTSPRSPEKMLPEIELLQKGEFVGKKWDKENQVRFMNLLNEQSFYKGSDSKHLDFSARDRINRGPKSLGLVVLKPSLEITPAGQELLVSTRKNEVFLRQLLKFQLPSPYHTDVKGSRNFWVKPYLEILRLISTLGTLRFDELQIFGLQLTDYNRFDEILSKINAFRSARATTDKKYKAFRRDYFDKELKEIYSQEISEGNTKTRESGDTTLSKFLRTKEQNLRDYADACFRYLRATGLVSVSHIGKSLSIAREYRDDVSYILKNTPRDPVYIDDLESYIKYLTNPKLPTLYTDDRSQLLSKLKWLFPYVSVPSSHSTAQLKELLYRLINEKKDKIIKDNILEIKDYKHYENIQDTYQRILSNEVYDTPLMMEWNTWRAMTMVDGGNIKANLSFDDTGNPITTASGNMSDIVCDYEDYLLSVEVTLSSGQRQYEMEGEPVSRHLGQLKKESKKPCYCLFIAPKISDATISHFYILHQLEISYYGGRSHIIPLQLSLFQKMLEDSYKADYIPSPNHIHNFLRACCEAAYAVKSEKEWYRLIMEYAVNWLKI